MYITDGGGGFFPPSQPPGGRTRLAARFRFRQAAQHGARLLHQARGPRNFVTNGEVGLFACWLVCLFVQKEYESN